MGEIRCDWVNPIFNGRGVEACSYANVSQDEPIWDRLCIAARAESAYKCLH